MGHVGSMRRIVWPPSRLYSHGWWEKPAVFQVFFGTLNDGPLFFEKTFFVPLQVIISCNLRTLRNVSDSSFSRIPSCPIFDDVSGMSLSDTRSIIVLGIGTHDFTRSLIVPGGIAILLEAFLG